MSEHITKQLRREIRAFIESDVVAGFDTPAEIVEGVLCAFSDEVLVETLRPLAEKLVARSVEKQRDEQADWPDVTDNDRLDAAFKELEEQYGILARQNYSDCLTGGHAALQEEVARARDEGRMIRGYTFFHAQDTDIVVECGRLFLAFGTLATDEEVARAILPKLLENEEAPLPEDREQPLDLKQEIMEKWREMFTDLPLPPTVAEALGIVQRSVRSAPMLERLGWMTMSPKNELAVFKVANDVVDVLQRHGLDATWEGLSERRIEVRLDWKRRR